MTVPKDLQAKVRRKVIDSVELVQAAYPSEVFPPILVTFERSYSTAGWAKCLQYQVNFDPILLVDNQDEFLKQIVPHEVAHVLAEHIHGHDINAHGEEWANVMILLGLEPLRLHELDTSKSRRRITRYEFTCGCNCGTLVHELSSVAMKKILVNKEPYRCVECEQPLIPVHPIAVPNGMPKKVALGTKQDKAKWVMKKHAKKSRKEVILLLVEVAGLTKAGAATYYYNLTNSVD